MAQEQSTPKRAPKEGEVAAIAEQVLDIFLDDEPPPCRRLRCALGYG